MGGGEGRKFGIDFGQFGSFANFLHTNYQKANVGVVGCAPKTKLKPFHDTKKQNVHKIEDTLKQTDKNVNNNLVSAT